MRKGRVLDLCSGVPGSNLDLDTRYPDRALFVVLCSLERQNVILVFLQVPTDKCFPAFLNLETETKNLSAEKQRQCELKRWSIRGRK